VVYEIISLMDETTQTQKPVVIKILQWLYLVIGLIYAIVGYWGLKNTSHPSIELVTIVAFLIPALFVLYVYSLVRLNLIIVRFTQVMALIIILGWLTSPYWMALLEGCWPRQMECPSLGAGFFQLLTTPLFFVSIIQIIISFYISKKIRSSPQEK
jgi:hypothetical protein